MSNLEWATLAMFGVIFVLIGWLAVQVHRLDGVLVVLLRVHMPLITSAFKRQATTLTPGFAARNLLSNAWLAANPHEHDDPDGGDGL